MKTKRAWTPLPTQAELHAVFDYDPDTGVLSYKGGDHPSRVAGAEVGYRTFQTRPKRQWTGKDYLRVRWPGRKAFYIQRIIWMWMTGEDPEEMVIDHKDDNPLNNKWDNLRKVTNAKNIWFAATKRAFWKDLIRGRFQIEQGELALDIYEDPENPSQ